MDITVIAFLGLLLAVAALRIFELRISRRHQQQMIARGSSKVNKPRFLWIVLVHTVILVAAAAEVVFLHRPFLLGLAAAMFFLFLASNGLRLWVIFALGVRWNVQVMDSTNLGVVTTGPFRFIRHPNYLAIFVEMFALPLIHTAWITALIGPIAYAVVIGQRIVVEEQVLFANPEYRAAMESKPRFLPGLF